MGVTGSGKTFTMANIIEQTQRPTLVLAHNKTLARAALHRVPRVLPGQRGGIFRVLLRLLPAGGVHRLDRYLYREGLRDQRRDRPPAPLRDLQRSPSAATLSWWRACRASTAWATRWTTSRMVISLRPGMELSRDALIRRLIEIQYERNDIDFERTNFRVRGDIGGDLPGVRRIRGRRACGVLRRRDRPHQSEIDALTGRGARPRSSMRPYFPASPLRHVQQAKLRSALIKDLDDELEERVKFFERQRQADRGAAHRAAHPLRHGDAAARSASARASRTTRAYCRRPRAGLSRLTRCIDYFPKDFLLFVDESHVTPAAGPRACTTATARARRTWSITASACPRAYDNRPLNFDEFDERHEPGRVSSPRRRATTSWTRSRPGGRAGHPSHRSARSGGRCASRRGPDRRSHRRDQRPHGQEASACSSRRSPRKWRRI